MPTTKKTGRQKRHRVGYIAIGYDPKSDFWYSSEGVFADEKSAIKDLKAFYSVSDGIKAIKVDLNRFT